MQYSLATSWQLEAIGESHIPRVDIRFPNTLASAYTGMNCEQLEQYQWYLNRDFTLDEDILARFSSIELVIGGIDYPVEVRLNGMALFDYPVGQTEVRKEIRRALNLGKNRLEILFLEPDDDEQLDGSWLDTHHASQQEQSSLKLASQSDEQHGAEQYSPKGIWLAPYLNCSHQLHLNQISVEQIWHFGLGCEVKIDVSFTPVENGMLLHTAHIRFGATSYRIPVDIRSGVVSAIFHLDAPHRVGEQDIHQANTEYPFAVDLDGQYFEAFVTLSEGEGRRVFPLGDYSAK